MLERWHIFLRRFGNAAGLVLGQDWSVLVGLWERASCQSPAPVPYQACLYGKITLLFPALATAPLVCSFRTLMDCGQKK